MGQSKGARSVLLIANPSFNSSTAQLEFERTDVTVLNLGTSEDTVVVKSAGGSSATAANKTENPAIPHVPTFHIPLAPGDEAFLRKVQQEMPKNMAAAAERLLIGVRKHHPGNLKEGDRRRFTETPDNFWMILVQPRKQNFYISVRGAPKWHTAKQFNITSGRNPNYSAFYLSDEAHVQEALDIVLRAKTL
ncbi:hypothetical protein ACVWZV_008582 [Bradyrhizobium sp. GM5.1]